VISNLRKRCTRHSHELFTSRRSQNRTFAGGWHEALYVNIVVVSDYGRWTLTIPAQLRLYSIFSDDFLDFHSIFIIFVVFP
jgi:hypothetical protein